MDAEFPSVFSEKIITARKEHRCCECYSTIKKGDKYHIAKGCWDGHWIEFKTCCDCNDLRHELKDSYYGLPPFEQLSEWAHDAEVSMPKAG